MYDSIGSGKNGKDKFPAEEIEQKNVDNNQEEEQNDVTDIDDAEEEDD